MPRQYTRIPPEQRFWKYVHKTDSCWLWTGQVSTVGYGIFWMPNQRGGGAHRFSYELHFGPIPVGMFICHTCDNRLCCRPDHLFLGTNADNMHDKKVKGRSASGEQHGSKTHPERLPRGESHHGAILTWGQVREIRARVTAGEQQVSIAQEYGVSCSMVSRIVTRQTWKEES